MTATVHTSTLIGAESRPIQIESDMSNSLPGMVIVGLGDKAVSESKERIRSAIKNSGLQNPRKRITINLSPADIPKDGTHFDLGMALSILMLSGQIPANSLQKTLVLGELGLNGDIKPVHGIVGHLLGAEKAGFETILIPMTNIVEARLVSHLNILPVRNLRELYLHYTDGPRISRKVQPVTTGFETRYTHDISEVVGQTHAKRGLEIAAAGGHNILMSGPPGSGKTMLAKMLPTIMPRMLKQQMIESTHLHSIAHASPLRIVRTPPFRSPHHTASHISLVGGGNKPSPGEVSLAHNGVLFLDEIAEFSRQSLEALRQPLEDGVIHVSRASNSVTFPANFILVATRNPCPCGYFGDAKKQCECTQQQIDKYQNKLSGPLLDRIDLFAYVDPTDHTKLLANTIAESSSKVRARVEVACERQLARAGKSNADLDSKDVKKKVCLSNQARILLNEAADKMSLSSRAYIKLIKVARTIADLAGSEEISPNHIAEALQFRQI